MMQSGMDDNWLYHFRFTTEPHKSAAVKLFYIALGHLSSLLGFQPEAAYQLSRWILGLTVLWSIFLLFKNIFGTRLLFWCAFILCVMGSGLGWLQLLTGWIPGRVTPIDYWLIDAYVFFSISMFPHFSFIICLLSLCLLLYYKFLEKERYSLIFGIVIAMWLVQLVNPITPLVIDVTILITTIMFRREKTDRSVKHIIGLAAIFLGQLPLLIYNFLVLTTWSVWSQFTVQNLTLSPSPLYYLWGFALFWPFVVVGFWIAIRKKDPNLIGLGSWILFAFLMAYAPLGIQRRFLLGITVPLAALAVQGLAYCVDCLAGKSLFFEKHKVSIYILFVFFTSLSSIYLSIGNSMVMKSRPAEYFYSSSLDPALLWLGENVSRDEFVLASPDTSLLIAQRSGLKVYLGHEMETLFFEQKLESVTKGYQSNLPFSFLSDLPVQWVVYGPLEQNLTEYFVPGDNLRLRFQNEDVRVYRISD